jgi:hypothetical protein
MGRNAAVSARVSSEGNAMSITVHQASVEVFVRTLGNMKAVLNKGEAFAATKKIDPAVLVNSRLAADMLPLSAQVQIATDGAKGCIARLAGIDIPSYADTETTFAELYERLDKTIAFIKGVTPAQLEGSETREIVMKFPGREMTFTGTSFLFGFSIPNVYFHVTTAYAILRHNGVDIGKMDFLGGQ